MQISALVLYGYNGERKVINFNLGKVNIITGGSKKGKSAIGDIIDYCFGDKGCTIPDGFVRNHVAWYGLQIINNSKYIFVARENPPFDQTSTNKCRYMLDSDVIPAKIDEGTTPLTSDDLVKFLSDEIGINGVGFQKIGGLEDDQSRITIRHAMFYCIQGQSDIDSKAYLFHNQNDPFIFQTIRLTLPFFLGAISKDNVAKIKEKRSLEKEKKHLEDAIKENDDLIGAGYQKGAALLAEAKDVGLLSDEAKSDDINYEEIKKELSEIAVSSRRPPTNNDEGLERLRKLQLQNQGLMERLSDVGIKISEANEGLKLFDGFSDESKHQKNRLESIGLFEKMGVGNNVCPFCKQSLPPNCDSVNEDIVASLKSLDSELNGVENSRPKLEEYLSSLQKEKRDLQNEIMTLTTQIDSLKLLDEKTKNMLDNDSKQQYVLGRINYWLENVQDPVSINYKSRLEQINTRLSEIDSLLDEEEIATKTKYAENIINSHFIEWSKTLKLEYSSSPYRYDDTKVTIFVDDNRPIPLSQMGSGQNWVGCHLMVSMAFQSFFVEHDRPVPNFIFLDQLSKAFYQPSEVEHAIEENENVELFYKFLFDVVGKLDGKLQLIVTDHANLKNEQFKDAVIKNWWGKGEDDYLVPLNWSIRPEK